MAKLWDEQQNNKLRDIQPNIGQGKETIPKQKLDTILTRIRIGHTRLTHEYLLKAEIAPHCGTCGQQLTIKHILMDCKKYKNTRRKYFNEQNLRTLFGKVNPYKILHFLRKINLLDFI